MTVAHDTTEQAADQDDSVRLTATIVSGELAAVDIPAAAPVDLAALKAGDPDPLEVVVRIPAGRSRRGWDYRPEALQDIVRQVSAEGAAGFLGHQRPENVEHEFPVPVTHWVGARWDPTDKAAYIRGVVDRAAGDLKRWIRAGVINSTSIFGVPTKRQEAGETVVTGYRLLSIDWTPRGRAGMPTAVVALGEMDEIPNGGRTMELAELFAELRRRGATPVQVLGEMGWTLAGLMGEIGAEPAALIGAIATDPWRRVAAELDAIGETRIALGLAPDAPPAAVVAAAKAARAAQVSGEQAARAQRLDTIIAEVAAERRLGDAPKALLGDLARGAVSAESDDAAARAIIGEIADRDYFRAVWSSAPTIRPIVQAGQAGRPDDTPPFLRPVKIAL